MADASAREAVPSVVKSADGAAEDKNTAYECNICYEMASEPVVTYCGHLYCWPCLYRWMQVQAICQSCPVCKAGIETEKVVPIYGRGSDHTDPRKSTVLPLKEEPEELIPRRPPGQRTVPVQRMSSQDGNFSVQPGLGIIPTLLGYQQPQGQAGQRDPLTPEQQHQAFLSRLLLMLGSFVIMCLLLF